ncbi:MAG: DHA2 family efflux MFS transporter permease subunit [Azospirillaceae bacterium]|nr:DHA2 family efflux MFS transporter permease subunit [Azospirillaceae bacterium]
MAQTAQDPFPPLHGSRLVLATVALSLATFMNVLDTTIANVALTTIAGDLGVSASQGTWVITSFGVANAIAVPLTGWLVQRVGQLRLFLSSVLLFVLASFLCGAATSLEMLLLFRCLQGLVAGPMIPLSQALLLQCYPRSKAGMAIALWAMTTVVAPVMGPILGGWFTDNYSWPWIFYINIPVGLVAAWICYMTLRGRETAVRLAPIDVVGLGLLVIWVGATQILLDKGQELDWFNSSLIVVLAIVAIIGFTFFVIWELTDAHPIVDLSLFKGRNFTAGAIAITLGYAAFFGNTVLIPMWLQRIMGYTATWAGLVTAPVGIFAIILSPLVGRAMGRIDPRVLATVAFLVFALCGFWRSGFSPDITPGDIAVTHLVQGIAMATFFIPLTAIILSGLPPSRIPAASGLYNFMRIMAGSFAASVWTTLWEDGATRHHAYLTESVTAFSAPTAMAAGGAQDLGFTAQQAYGLIDAEVTRQSFILSATDLFWLSGVLFLTLIGLIWLAHPARRGGAPVDAGGAH